MSTLVIKELQQNMNLNFTELTTRDDLKCQIIQQKKTVTISLYIFLPEKLVPLILKFYHDDHASLWIQKKTVKLIKTFFA